MRAASTCGLPCELCGGSGFTAVPSIDACTMSSQRTAPESLVVSSSGVKPGAAVALQDAGIEQHHLLQTGADGFLRVESFADEDELLGQALQLRMRIVVVPGDAVASAR